MNRLSTLIRLALIVFNILFLVACGSSTPTPTATPLPPTPEPTQSTLRIQPGSITGTVDIGRRSLEIICLGEGSPAVIFEAGLGMSWGGWAAALREVSKHTMACGYNRAGIGQSDPPTEVPRTIQDFVDDLHALLTNTPIPGPYILAGHSLGGLTIRLYTSQYPQEVVGLIFADSTHPYAEGRMCAALPAASEGEDAEFTQARADCAAAPTPIANWGQVFEGLDIETSYAQALDTGPFGDLPLVVLEADLNFAGPPGTLGSVQSDCWYQLQEELADLSTQGQHLLVFADHQRITSQPETYAAIIGMVTSLQNP